MPNEKKKQKMIMKVIRQKRNKIHCIYLFSEEYFQLAILFV